MRKVFPLNPVLLSNLTSVQRGRVILGAKVEGILGEWSGCHTGNGGKVSNS